MVAYLTNLRMRLSVPIASIGTFHSVASCQLAACFQMSRLNNDALTECRRSPLTRTLFRRQLVMSTPGTRLSSANLIHSIPSLLR